MNIIRKPETAADGYPDWTKSTDQYELRYFFDPKSRQFEFRVRSRSGGKNHGVHTHYNLVSEGGDILENPPITPNIAELIFDNFEQHGETSSFEISEEQVGRTVRHGGSSNRSPNHVRHQLGATEHSFTSTGAKLAHHRAIFDKFRETGYGSIIRATMTLHQVCGSSCPYCSTILRNRTDSISLEEAKAFVTRLYERQAEFNRDRFQAYNKSYKDATGSDIRLRGLILSGGGQPNLWPHFTEFVDWLAGKDIDLGLITNGFPKNVPEGVYSHFKWIRVSITPEEASPHYPNRRFDHQYLPETIKHRPDITVGYSYVFGPWTDDGIIRRIDQSMDANGFRYCRTLTDCNLTRDGQLKAHRALAERLYELNLIDQDGNPTGLIFHQLKYHGERDEGLELWDQGQCFLQVYNTFWDTTGHEKNGFSHCYPCDSVTVLAEERADGRIIASERRFNSEKWGTVPNTRVEELYTEPVKPHFDPRDLCSSCLFMRNNRTAKELTRGTCPDSGNLGQLEHVNFP